MNKLTPDHFSFKCPMNWDEMEISGSGRHCSKCQKQVFDLTNCSIDEVIALQHKHGKICGSIQVAVAAISLSAAACQEMVPGRANDRMEKEKALSHTMTTGMIMPPNQLHKVTPQAE